MRPITPEELVVIKEYLLGINPVANALDVLQDEDKATAGYLLPTLQMVIEELESISNLHYMNGLVASLQTAIKRRFQEELESSWFKVAAAVHPNYKLYWVKNEEVDFVTTVVKAKLRVIEERNSNLASATMVSLTDGEPKAKLSLFWRMSQKRMESSTDKTGLVSLWGDWVKSADCIIPARLRRVFLQYNTTLCSSAAVERFFLLGKQV